jgi:FAIM1 (Fas apoptotic inhibitory molecule) protein
MSEANNVWRVDVDGAEHDIEVEHSTMTGKIVVKLDGKAMDEQRLWFSKEQMEFPVGSKSARVTVEYAYGGFASRSSLHLDGRYVEPLRR